jgi:hypothetical protein
MASLKFRFATRIRHNAILLALGIVLSGAALGHAQYVQLTTRDLGACKKEIGEVHRDEISFLKKRAAQCTDSNCTKVYQQGIRESENQNDLAWFAKGNDHCDGSDYPCFSIPTINDEDDANYQKKLANGPTHFQGGVMGFDLNPAEKCLAKVWLGKQSGGKAGRSSSVRATDRFASSETSQSSSKGGVTAPNVNLCVGVEKTNEEIHLFNKCSTATDIAHRGESQLNVAYCLIGTDAKGQLAECGGPRFAEWINGYTSDTGIPAGIREFGPRGLGMRVSRHRARRVAFLACQQPYHPSGVTFQNNGLKGTCMKCNSWAQDGKNTCISPTE